MTCHALERDCREQRKKDLRLAELCEPVVIMIRVRRVDHVSPKGEEADDQAEDQLGNRARRLEEYGQADDGQLAHAPAVEAAAERPRGVSLSQARLRRSAGGARAYSKISNHQTLAS